MTREDIYDHLAQVYLGKRKESDDKSKRQKNAWLGINIVITLIIFASAFYGLTAFLTSQSATFNNYITFELHNGPVRMDFNFKQEFPPVKTFTLDIAQVDASQYQNLGFSIRGLEEGLPGIVKVELKTQRNETSYFYIEGVGLKWQEHQVPLSQFKDIADFSTLKEISFTLESWNVKQPRGAILIDDIRFSGANRS